MMTFAVLLGVGLAAGLVLLADFFTRGRAVTLGDRLAPHFGSAPTAGPVRWRGLAPRRRPARSSDPALATRLAAAGVDTDPVAYRQGGLVAATLAGGVAVVFIVVVSLTRTVSPVAALALVSGCVAASIVLRRHRLDARITARRRRMEAQFPALAELLALAVAAGDSVGPALERCTRGMRGDLADELDVTLAELRSGRSLPAALTALARRTSVPSLARCVEAIVAAGERGTPVAGVLRDQAADARELLRRELMERAGKKEVGMLVPVVFGVLPLSVLFAVYPALDLLSFGV